MIISKNISIGIDTEADFKNAREKVFMDNLEGIVSDVDGVITNRKSFYGQKEKSINSFMLMMT